MTITDPRPRTLDAGAAAAAQFPEAPASDPRTARRRPSRRADQLVATCLSEGGTAVYRMWCANPACPDNGIRIGWRWVANRSGQLFHPACVVWRAPHPGEVSTILPAAESAQINSMRDRWAS